MFATWSTEGKYMLVLGVLRVKYMLVLGVLRVSTCWYLEY